MRRLSGLTVLGLSLLVTGLAAPPAAARTPPGEVEVVFERGVVAATIGDRFALSSVVANTGTVSAGPFLAHLNVAGLTHDVYVDPEDWSASRSQEVGAIPPGGRARQDWQLQAVNAGSFDVYVVLLPDGATSAGAGPLGVSPPVHVTVAARRTFSAGGALPVAITVPLVLAVLAGATRYRHRRTG